MKNKFLPITLISLSLIGLEIALLVIYAIQFNGGLSNKQETWGQLGDFIGGIANPLLSSISIILLIYSINLQTQNTDDQKKKDHEKEDKIKIEKIEEEKRKKLSDFISLMRLIEVEIQKSDQIIETPQDINQTITLLESVTINGTNALHFTNNVYEIFCKAFFESFDFCGKSSVFDYYKLKYVNKIRVLRLRKILEKTNMNERFINENFI